jgi:hypothetical protein
VQKQLIPGSVHSSSSLDYRRGGGMWEIILRGSLQPHQPTHSIFPPSPTTRWGVPSAKLCPYTPPANLFLTTGTRWRTNIPATLCACPREVSNGTAGISKRNIYCVCKLLAAPAVAREVHPLSSLRPYVSLSAVPRPLPTLSPGVRANSSEAMSKSLEIRSHLQITADLLYENPA